MRHLIYVAALIVLGGVAVLNPGKPAFAAATFGAVIVTALWLYFSLRRVRLGPGTSIPRTALARICWRVARWVPPTATPACAPTLRMPVSRAMPAGPTGARRTDGDVTVSMQHTDMSITPASQRRPASAYVLALLAAVFAFGSLCGFLLLVVLSPMLPLLSKVADAGSGGAAQMVLAMFLVPIVAVAGVLAIGGAVMSWVFVVRARRLW